MSKIKRDATNRGCKSLSSYHLEYCRHFARFRRRRAHAPASNNANHDNHEEENQFMGFLFFPIWVWGSAWRRSSAENNVIFRSRPLRAQIVMIRLGYLIKPGFQAPQESSPIKSFCFPPRANMHISTSFYQQHAANQEN